MSVDEPLVVRPSRCIRMRTEVESSATFWWITELANRVNARRDRLTATSTSAFGAAAVVSSRARWAIANSLIGAP